jgi:hypothetical protein
LMLEWDPREGEVVSGANDYKLTFEVCGIYVVWFGCLSFAWVAW